MVVYGTYVYPVGKAWDPAFRMEQVLRIAKLLLIAAVMVPAACDADLRRGDADRADADLRASADVRSDADLRAEAERAKADTERSISAVRPDISSRASADTAPEARASADTSEFREKRVAMVRRHIAARGIDNPRVLEALRSVPRHLFVPEAYVEQAYADRPLPIGHGQTISQPYIVAYMTALVEPDPSDRVLEIGTGSGYQAAVLAEIVDAVHTIEIIPELSRTAHDRLQKLGYDNVTVRHADGYFGWEEHAPFDAIIVTAAAEHIPPPLIDQLKDGGRMIIPVGSPFRTQTLMLVEKQGDELSTRSLAPVRFVPFTRDD